MKIYRSYFILAFLIGILSSSFHLACQSTHLSNEKEERQYGTVQGAFRHRWWNYYERALSFAEGSLYEDASADLKKAIGGRDKDQRMARKYGMHFVEDYFPHRELGIVYFYMGRYDEAEMELEKSLSQVDTGRAKYFLNEARKALLERSAEDAAPPVINVVSVSESEATNSFRLTLEGDVEDDFYASKIAINEEPLFVELSAKKLPFSKEIKLKKGLNTIKISSSDLLGKETEKEIKVIADYEGPSLNFNNYYDGQVIAEKKILLKGTLVDATGVRTLKINSTVYVYGDDKTVAFAFPVDLNPGENRIPFAATDIAGNTTRGEITLLSADPSAKSDARNQYALLHRPGSLKPAAHQYDGSDILYADLSGRIYAADSRKNNAAFRLNIKDLRDTETVYLDRIYLDGSVAGSNKINSVTINDSPLLIVPGKTIYFNQLLDLKKGENRFIIEATDEKGNKKSRTITIVRRIQEERKLGSRMSLAVLPFKKEGATTIAGDRVYNNLVGAILEQERFNIVARGEDLEAVIRELKFSLTDLVDKDNAVKVGKLVAAEGILMGTVIESRDSIEIYVRLINTETSIIMEAKDVYGQGKTFDEIQYLAKGLAWKLKNSFPLIEGIVIEKSGSEIFADFGRINGIKENMKFIVFRLGDRKIHPDTGKSLESPTEVLGVATIVDVYKEMSMGKLLADFEASKIKTRDMVITK